MGGLDGESADAPALVAAGDALDLLVRTPDDRLRARRLEGGAWGAWRDLEGAFDGPPGAASWGGSRLDVLVRGLDNHVWQKWRA